MTVRVKYAGRLREIILNVALEAKRPLPSDDVSRLANRPAEGSTECITLKL